jgi:hypothetical protein
MIPQPFKEGNAVIAAKTKNGRILWSWHIWITDKPRKVVYNNNAGAMMERNLGATGWQAGQPGSLGLMYQWGRKDPFPGSAALNGSVMAKTTAKVYATISSATDGTIEYSIKNPSTIIFANSARSSDWLYNDGTAGVDNSRWQSAKTIYDPCPVGWRVPDGGENGVWKIAGFEDDHYAGDDGFFFKIASPSYSWYPAAGCRGSVDDKLYSVGRTLRYWSVTTNDRYASRLFVFTSGNGFQSSNFAPRVCASSVRCFRESL